MPRVTLEEVRFRLQHVLRHTALLLQDNNCTYLHGDVEVIEREIRNLLNSIEEDNCA